MKKLLIVTITLAFSLILFSCKKDDDKTSKSSFLTNNSTKEWRISKVIINGEDATDDQDACSFDDVQRFFSDGRFEGDEGATKCNSGDPQIYSMGEWQLVDNDTKLIISYDGESEIADIIRLTNDNLDYETSAGFFRVEIQSVPNQ